MFDRGERVVCINDEFDPLHKRIYSALPSKGSVYTVRECTIGRTRTGTSDKGVSYLILLDELKNPLDPFMHPSQAQELGFRSDRFSPVQEIENEEEACVAVSSPIDPLLA